MGNQLLYPRMQNYANGDRRTHMGIPVCLWAGINKIFAYGDPHLHNKNARIWGVTYTHNWILDPSVYLSGCEIE
jgi:hypothetical protein